MAVATANNPSVESGAGMACGNGYYAPRLRAAIVGTGGISRIHGWRLQDLGSTVVGVCGRDIAKARSIADEFRPYGEADSPAAHSTTSRPCSTRPSPTCCMSAARTDFTRHTRIEAVNRGINVIIEKPMATSLADARALIAAAEARRRRRRGVSDQTVVSDGRRTTRTESWRASSARSTPSAADSCPGTPITTTGRGDSTRRSQEPLMPQPIWACTGWTSPSMSPGGGSPRSMRGSPPCDPPATAMVSRSRSTPRTMCAFSSNSPGVWSGPRRSPESRQVSRTAAPSTSTAPKVASDGRSTARTRSCTACADGSVATITRNPDALAPAAARLSFSPAGHAEGFGDAFRNLFRDVYSAIGGADVSYPTLDDGYRMVALVEAIQASARARRAVSID